MFLVLGEFAEVKIHRKNIYQMKIHLIANLSYPIERLTLLSVPRVIARLEALGHCENLKPRIRQNIIRRIHFSVKSHGAA